MSKRLIFWLAIALLLVGTVAFFRFGPVGSDIVWNLTGGGKYLLPLVSISALVDSINPCAFSILLLTIAFLFSLGQARGRILLVGGIYILGIFLAYVGIGLGLLEALHIFNTPHFMAKVGAFLLIFWGLLNLINEFFPSFPIRLKIPNAVHGKIAELMEKASIPAALGLGALVGLCEFPCTGGPYLLVLGLLHDNATFWPGLGYLLIYNLIFVLPLEVALFIASDKQFTEKVRRWQKEERKEMRVAGGAIMVLLGVVIFFL